MAGHVHLLYSDKSLGETLQRQLQSAFFHVTISEEAEPETAIEQLKREQPEVIGLVRGQQTSFETFRKLKQAFPNRSLVAFDPIPSERSTLTALQSGADSHIGLPVSPTMLSLRVSALLRQSRKMEDAASTDDVLRLLGFDPTLLAMPDDSLDGVRLDIRHEDPNYAQALSQCLEETGFICTVQPFTDHQRRIAKDGLIIGALTDEGWRQALTLISRERGRAATRNTPIIIAAPILPPELSSTISAVDVQDIWIGAAPDRSLAISVKELVRGTKQSVQRRRALVQSLDLAITDGLTGLFNQRYLAAHLPMQMQLARQSDRALSFVLLDLDGFKGLNDTYGHQAGDQFLISVAEHLRSNSRTSDSAVRLGGDEFAMVLPNAAGKDARSVVERLVRDISEIQHAGSDEGKIRISASAGLVTMQPQDWTSTADALIAVADARLYAAKEKGGNQIVDTAPS
ncbi:MAG: diguanylate cyclase [Alphaproteobacteria bacterium]